MKDSNFFRKINQIELNMIQNSLINISSNIIPFLEKIDFELFIIINNSSSKSTFPKIYLVPKNLIESIKKIKLNKYIKSSGLYFGMIKKGEFYLSLEGAEFLHAFKCFYEKNIIQVNKEGEKSILYGNHILKKNIIKISSDLTKNDLLIILNESEELIALARANVNFLECKNLKSNEIFAFNLVDKGYYLREKQ